MSSEEKTKVILVGVGGATCSGKTTLAKHLRRILPDSVILHQDDFAPPQELVPVHPVYGVQDWDAAPGAIVWPRMVAFLRHVKATGDVPAEHYSHDHLNENRAVPVEDALAEKWAEEFSRIRDEHRARGVQVKYGLVDGFLLYWHPEVVDLLDMCVFLRVPYDVLKQRRHERHGYHTAVQTDPEGSLWRDPPHYWEQIVWPAYVDAHKGMFVGGDVEHGRVDESFKGRGLLVIEGMDESMSRMIEECCTLLKDTVASP